MIDPHYAALDAWNELIRTTYGEAGKYQIEILMERMALGLFKWLPKWTILVGDSGTGKSTLIRIIWRMFYADEQIIGVSSHNPMNLGQYNDESLGICDDADVHHMYKEIEEKWSGKYHLLIATNKEPDSDILENDAEVSIIRPTGQKISSERYKELVETIYDGIFELRLYFREKGGINYVKRWL